MNSFKSTKTRHKQKPTSKTKTSEQQRQQFFACIKTSKKVKIVLRFGAQNFSVKKTNRLEIVLITSSTLLLTYTPINPPMENLFFYQCWHKFFIKSTYFLVCDPSLHLFASARIWMNVKTSKVLIFFFVENIVTWIIFDWIMNTDNNTKSWILILVMTIF